MSRKRPDPIPDREGATAYLVHHGLPALFESLLKDVITQRPETPHDFLLERLTEAKSSVCVAPPQPLAEQCLTALRHTVALFATLPLSSSGPDESTMTTFSQEVKELLAAVQQTRRRASGWVEPPPPVETKTPLSPEPHFTFSIPSPKAKTFSEDYSFARIQKTSSPDKLEGSGLCETLRKSFVFHTSADVTNSSPAAENTDENPTVEFKDHNQRIWLRSGRLLGSGATGQVYLGQGSNGELVALKTMKFVVPDASRLVSPQSRLRRRSTQGAMQITSAVATPGATDPGIEEVLKEVSLLSTLRHENIVRYISSCVANGTLVIVIEYVPGGSLSALKKEFTFLGLTATQRYVRDIVRGLQYLHEHDIIHRDIKPHNVLLMIDGQCKLTDFGASSKLGQLKGETNKVQGTPLYMAPEQCMGEVCKASDVWGVGVLTYELLTGNLPFEEAVLNPFNPFMFMYRLGREDTFVPVLGPALASPLARDFCEAILKRDATQRPTATELLSHPFLMSRSEVQF